MKLVGSLRLVSTEQVNSQSPTPKFASIGGDFHFSLGLARRGRSEKGSSAFFQNPIFDPSHRPPLALEA